MIKKTVEAWAKTGLHPTSYISEMDQQTQWANRLTHVIAAKVQTESTAIKNLRIEEPKPKT